MVILFIAVSTMDMDSRSNKSASVASSRILRDSMQWVLDKLKFNTTRESTAKNYLHVWRQFNNFLIRLDLKPTTWEERILLFAAHLIEEKRIQSQLLKSYYSAIKSILRSDDYIVDDNKVYLGSLAKACRLVNDKVRTRLPIQNKLLELLLFKVERIFMDQPYLEIMYKTIFLLAYYGLFRISELTTAKHPIKARDVHTGMNKNKMLFILCSSKTHGLESRPQKVKITANSNNVHFRSFFCPFKTSREYLALRGNYVNDSDPFFIFRDHSPVTPPHVRCILNRSLQAIDLKPELYGLHSFRIGWASDMMKFKCLLAEVKLAGRWKSNVVYKYIRHCE